MGQRTSKGAPNLKGHEIPSPSTSQTNTPVVGLIKTEADASWSKACTNKRLEQNMAGPLWFRGIQGLVGVCCCTWPQIYTCVKKPWILHKLVWLCWQTAPVAWHHCANIAWDVVVGKQDEESISSSHHKHHGRHCPYPQWWWIGNKSPWCHIKQEDIKGCRIPRHDGVCRLHQWSVAKSPN